MNFKLNIRKCNVENGKVVIEADELALKTLRDLLQAVCKGIEDGVYKGQQGMHTIKMPLIQQLASQGSENN